MKDPESDKPASHAFSRRQILTGTVAAAASAALPSILEGDPLGAGRRPYGERSPFEHSVRYFKTPVLPGNGANRTPLQDSLGIITPSALHYERHHAGVPSIDPAKHELLIHGLVKNPLVLTLDDLKRYPAVSHVHFVECAGNSGREQEGRPGEDVQKSHGLLSCSEWTGVPLAVLLRDVGLRPNASWVVAESADACRMARSIPLSKAMDDVIIAYGQNGEAIRPEQGYPLRLLVPGWEGNINIKWLRRLQVSDQPGMHREEAVSYTDLMPDGRSRRFSFEMDVKSVITRPSGGQSLPQPGNYEISGLAWSGRGKVVRVQVSVDAGKKWQDAVLNQPVLPKAFTRFSLPWKWNGDEAWIQSRATDETGDYQPTRLELIAVRGVRPGPDGFDHYNGIKSWHVKRDGSVSHV
jgi:sulfane dehydrogenase subunit SoxC